MAASACSASDCVSPRDRTPFTRWDGGGSTRGRNPRGSAVSRISLAAGRSASLIASAVPLASVASYSAAMTPRRSVAVRISAVVLDGRTMKALSRPKAPRATPSSKSTLSRTVFVASSRTVRSSSGAKMNAAKSARSSSPSNFSRFCLERPPFICDQSSTTNMSPRLACRPLASFSLSLDEPMISSGFGNLSSSRRTLDRFGSAAAAVRRGPESIARGGRSIRRAIGTIHEARRRRPSCALSFGTRLCPCP